MSAPADLSILHGTWIENRFHLWVETGDGPADDPAAHLEPLGLETGPAGTIDLTLPARRGRPLPSSALLQTTDGGGQAGLQPCSLAALPLAPLDAARFLGTVGDGPVLPGLLPGSDLAYWAQVARWADGFRRRQDVIPALARDHQAEDEDGHRPCWLPWFRTEEFAAFPALVRGMVPACLAHLGKGIYEDPAGYREAAGRLVLEVVRLLVDHRCREACADTAAALGLRADDNPHDNWLAGLCRSPRRDEDRHRPGADQRSLDSVGLPRKVVNILQRYGHTTLEDVAALNHYEFLDLPGIGRKSYHLTRDILRTFNLDFGAQSVVTVTIDLTELAGQLDDWHRRLQPEDWGGLRFCLRLEEPQGRRKYWRLTFLLQAADDPSLMVEAATLWDETNNGAIPEVLGRRLQRADERLLVALARGARIFPPLNTALRSQRPTHCRLTTEEAYSFLQEAPGSSRKRDSASCFLPGGPAGGAASPPAPGCTPRASPAPAAWATSWPSTGNWRWATRR